jgi:LPXTG-site transpeptidase (sortase) family protein
MKANTSVALPLMAMGVVLTAFSFYWLSVHHASPAPPQSAPVLSSWTFDGWVPPMQPPAPAAPAQQPPVSSAPIVRFSAPRVGINAAVEVLTLDGTGAMQDPSTPTKVAWYDFSARPGQLGNVVIAGHVDYANFGPAVFWRLRDLKQGDRVEITLSDGLVFIYEVESLNYYQAANAPVKEITGPTDYEAITLITCGGSFNRGSRSYNERLIVRATRITNTASTN